MSGYPKPIKNVISEFKKLPGIGKRSAERIALELLKRDNNDALALSDAVKNLVSSVKECKVCHSFSEEDLCDICSSPARDRKILCIVEEAKETARAEGERIVTAANAEIEREINQAKEALRAQVASIAVAGAEKVLKREIDAKSHDALLNDLAAEI